MTEDNETTEQFDMDEVKTVCHFMSLKNSYATGRKDWEQLWDQAFAAFNIDKTKLLDQRYVSDSKFISPKMMTKLKGIVGRKMRILFNVEPFGRIEDSKVRKAKPKSLVDLWNRYIFNYQIPKIKLKTNYRLLSFLQGIYGVAVAYLPHEYEEKTLVFADGKTIEVETKNDTFMKPILTGDFYTDPSKLDLRESQANIYETTVNFEDLKELEKRVETFIDETELEDGTVIQSEREEEVGVYFNLDKIKNAATLTTYQEQYIKQMYYSHSGTSGSLEEYGKPLKTKIAEDSKKSKKTGMVRVDKCFGKYWFKEDGKLVYDECIAEIANGNILIRLERTPYQHTNYDRPFLAMHENPMMGSFYCHGPVTASMDLFHELNANRQMATDAKKRTVFPMKYIDVSKAVNWDGKWEKDGVVKGQGPAPFQDLVNPYLGNVTNADNQLFSNDIDTVFNLSPVQEGVSDKSQIPGTARGTAAIIAQNDVPLNDKMNDEVEEFLKPFLEILFERNMQFKTLEDLLHVWEQSDIAKLLSDLGQQVASEDQLDDIIENFDLTELFFEPKIKILGNMELNNEVAQQAGYTQFIQFASKIPPIAKRVNWLEVSQKMLRSYGIKDDADYIFIDEEAVKRIDEQNAQGQQQQEQQQKQSLIEMKGLDVQEFQAQEGIKTQNKIVEMEAEALLEQRTGQKVQ